MTTFYRHPKALNTGVNLAALCSPNNALTSITLTHFFVYGGVSDAGKQQWFHVIKQPSAPESVLIRNYGEYLLAVPFTRITRKANEDETPAPFERQLILIKMSDVKTPLCFEKVGPLQPKPEVKP